MSGSSNPNLQLIGSTIKIKTVQGNEHQGELFGYDMNTYECIVLKEDDEKGNFSLTVLRNNAISKVLDAQTNADYTPILMTPFNLADVQAREDRNLNEAIRRNYHWKEGITESTMNLYNEIEKTFNGNCRWVEDDIDILDGTCCVVSPYDVSCVKGGNEQTIKLVQKLILRHQAKEAHKEKELAAKESTSLNSSGVSQGKENNA